MANPFLNRNPRDIETALLLEKAIVHDIGNIVACTDGNRVFVNTPDNLFKILPSYNDDMLKWLLWHERMHKELKHHERFFAYLNELKEKSTLDKFQVTKEEVNIIMDILVHDWMSDKFPELVETAKENLAQFRNRNSLGYTFKTHNLEDMLNEFAEHKKGEQQNEEGKGNQSTDGEGEEAQEEQEAQGQAGEDKDKKNDDKKEDDEGTPTGKKGHGESSKPTPSKQGEKKLEDGKPDIKEDETEPLPDEHNNVDWSKLEDIDEKEFIDEHEANCYERQVQRLKNMKMRLAKITETLNGFVTSSRRRTYARPSTTYVGGGILLKGSEPGKTSLYLVFDASGSMSGEMALFKEIISKSIPQAMNTPTEWFSGAKRGVDLTKLLNPEGRNPDDYFKGTFKDFMNVHADWGYCDDGDRTIELCWKAEQQGFTPIGVTDGGGSIGWSTKYLKQLKRTVFVGQNPYWLKDVRKINPAIQTICTAEED